MPTLIWLAWIAAGLVFAAAAWALAQRFTSRALLPASRVDQMLVGCLLAAFAVLGAVLAWRRILLMPGAGLLVVSALLTAVTIIDFRSRRIPDALNLALFAWAVAQIAVTGEPGFAASGLGLLISGGVFLLLAVVGRGAMGLGDVKLAAALGALLGFPQVLLALVIGVFAGGLAAVGLLIAGRGKRGATMAYGPYLALGGWVALLGAVFGWRV